MQTDLRKYHIFTDLSMLIDPLCLFYDIIMRSSFPKYATEIKEDKKPPSGNERTAVFAKATAL